MRSHRHNFPKRKETGILAIWEQRWQTEIIQLAVGPHQLQDFIHLIFLICLLS